MEGRARYGLLNNIAYSVKTYWEARKSLLFYAAAGVLLRVALPFAGILMPKLVIDALEGGAGVGAFLGAVGALALLMVALNFGKSFTDVKVDENIGNQGSITNGEKSIGKLMDMDYENLEDPSVKKVRDKAAQAARSNHTPAANHLRTVTHTLSNLLGIAVYGGVIATIHPLILPVLALASLVNWLVLTRARKYEESTREERSAVRRKISYISHALSDRQLAKDMRLYSMPKWLFAIAERDVKTFEVGQGRVETRTMLWQWTDGLMILLRDGAAYALLIWLLLGGNMALGDFVLMFAAVGSFATWVSGLLVGISDLMRADSEISDLRAWLDYPDRRNRGPGAALPPMNRAPGIRLDNVSYTYPGAQKPALEGIDIEIKPGERIAVVGANGAGKTTLIKLLCGLYTPTTGTVYTAGVDAAAYNRDEYFTLFSAVFQDIYLLSDSIACNVSQQAREATDPARARRCLELAGLYDKIASLPMGMDTLLVRQVHSDAVELSGGELQKLALARALYKDAPIILLDEPTAALDPIAENEMYRQYAELTEGKTSVYISHRLASTRFCDRILFIDGNRIAEEGSHDALMRKDGGYAHMFSVQASYYNEAKEGEAHA